MRRRPGQLLAAMAIASGLLVTGSGPAAAHAEIRSSDPDAGGVAPVGLEEISLTFLSMDPEEPVEVSVLDPDGNEMVDGDLEISDTGATGTTVVVPVRPLSEGPHFLSWKAMSADGDGITTGNFEFGVEPSSGGGGAGVWLLWIVALGILAAVLLRPKRRRPAP